MNTLKTTLAAALITLASGLALAQTPAATNTAPAATAPATTAPATTAKTAPAVAAAPTAAAPAEAASGAKHGHKQARKHAAAAKTEPKTQ